METYDLGHFLVTNFGTIFGPTRRPWICRSLKQLSIPSPKTGPNFGSQNEDPKLFHAKQKKLNRSTKHSFAEHASVCARRFTLERVPMLTRTPLLLF